MSGANTAPFNLRDLREFRARLRLWFAEQLPTGWASDLWDDPVDDAAEIAFLRQWQRRLYEGGWTGLSWPKEFGGVGATLLEQAVFVEERDRAKAPLDVGIVGTQMVGPMLIKHGSPEQKGKYLRRILSGEDLWCQGFSEPSAGSDLAALSTRAEWRQDAWHINGQKVWTSRAQYADLMILLARSEAKSTSHQGITAFIVPMSTPGLAIRPLRQINGSTDFCEVFLDDVVLESESVVGEIGGGWKVAMSTLSFERFATTRAFEMRRLVIDLLDAVNLSVQEKDGGPAADPSLADTLARHLCEAHAAGLSYQRMVAEIASRGEVGVEASVGKLFTTELGKRVATTAMTALPYANIDSPVMPWRGGCISWPLEFINGFKNTIAAGTSQIQRNIIGERVLQLPRQRGTRQ